MNAQPQPAQEEQQSALDQFGLNLTERARQGKLDPVIGRDEARSARVMQVLTRRTKNNPVLIGEPGVGKTAVVEGLAQRIVQDDVARVAQGQAAATRSTSRPWSRARCTAASSKSASRRCSKEITESDGRIITFIDELHTWSVRRRRRRDRRGLQHAQADARARRAAPDRRDDARRVPQVHREGCRARAPLPAGVGRRAERARTPSRSSAACEDRYEAHHKVADRRRRDRGRGEPSRTATSPTVAPADKAIDLIDEAASRLRMEIDSAPLEIDELRRHVDRLKLEELALKKEKDAAAKERLAALRETLKVEQKKLDELQARWERERASLNAVGELEDEARPGPQRGRARAARGQPREGVAPVLRRDPALERQVAEAEPPRPPRPPTASGW